MIIKSLLDTDLYKLTMMQTVLHQTPAAQVEYRFVNRSSHIDLRPYEKHINEAIDQLCTLRFTKDELNYLSSLRFIKSDFIDFLRLFEFNRDFIEVKSGEKNLEINIKGPWLHTILFEIPVLAIVSEVYFKDKFPEADLKIGHERLNAKIELIRENAPGERFKISDFGTRRRFSREWQGEVLKTFIKKIPNYLAGTSNVFYAKTLNILPLGTMAHEYIQAYQALGSRLVDSQKAALNSWQQEYRGDLGIALSDTYGLEPFLRDFDLYFCKLFDGVRHDSGDPFTWGDRILAHYKENRVDPKTKTLIFSDNLTSGRALELFHYFKDRTNTSFGIGTKLTNDVGYEPLSIVIKMVRCNGQAVAKISDEPSKEICDDPDYLSYVKHVFKIGQGT